MRDAKLPILWSIFRQKNNVRIIIAKIRKCGEYFTSLVNMAERRAKPKLEERLTISLPKDQYELIGVIADKEGVSKSKIIRDAVKRYLDKDVPLFEGL